MATVCIASSWAVRKTRMAISWKRATATDEHIGQHGGRDRATYASVRDEDLGERTMMASSLATDGLDVMNWGLGGGWSSGKGACETRRMEILLGGHR